MTNAMSDIDIIGSLRTHARQGDSVVTMYNYVKNRLIQDGNYHALHVVHYFRQAFGLTFFETKPILALISAEDRSITDESLLHNLVFPAIELHRSEWELRMDSTGRG
jgi:hypothetical protein